MQLFNALDADAAAAVAFDARAHGNQHLGQVGNFWLLGGVFEEGFALGQRGGHEEVFGAGHRHHVGGDARAFQARAPRRQRGKHVAVLDDDVRAHRLQAFDVLVHRA